MKLFKACFSVKMRKERLYPLFLKGLYTLSLYLIAYQCSMEFFHAKKGGRILAFSGARVATVLEKNLLVMPTYVD